MKRKLTRGHVFIAASADGFVARKDHSLDWLMKQSDDPENKSYENFIANIDVIVMGSGSYKTVLGFDAWPYEIPVMVMSNTLTPADIPARLEGKVELTNLAPTALMEVLYLKDYKHAYVDGGKLVQSFIREGLVEDMTITLIPILIGDGIRLFGDIKDDIDLELIKSYSYNAGFVQNHYRLTRSLT